MKNLNIYIEQLGPIRNTDIKLAPVMIFTGASNLGKSYTNFLVYYVFSLFSGNRLNSFIDSFIEENIQNDKYSFTFTLKDLKAWMEKDVKRFFSYLLNYPDVPCRIRFNFDKNIDIDKQYSVTFKDFLFENNKDKKESFKIFEIQVNGRRFRFPITTIKKSEFIAIAVSWILSEDLLNINIHNAYLLPPGRASLLNESFTNQVQASKVGMYDIFLKDFDAINNRRINSLQEKFEKDRAEINDKITQLIDGRLAGNKDGIILKLKDNTEMPLSAAASSIKELSPFLMWMQTTSFKYDSMCIEEPEAHAHPEMQFEIADLIARSINKGALIQFTTHSDYLLNRINQLIRLGDMKKSDPERFDYLCNKECMDRDLTLDKNLINAYYFEKTDNGVNIIKQNLKNGLPFTTFERAVKKQLEWDSFFEEEEDV